MSLRLLLLMLCLLTPLQNAEAQKDSNLLKRGQEEFSQQRYPRALDLFRNHLRQHPEDQEAWIWFGVAYFYTGQAKTALDILQKAKPSPEMKAFVRFYIALSHDAMGEKARAKRILRQLAKSKEPLAEEALFELAATEYEDGEASNALKSVEEYQRRFPKGRYQKAIASIKERLTAGGLREIAGTKRADYKENFFKGHPLSLISMPHMWFYDLGYNYVRGERANPGYRGGQSIVQTGVAYEEYRLRAQAGMIMGPFFGQGTSSYAGYVYTQNWLSDSERMQDYFNDPTDFTYFPFRPDLMERDHRLFVETIGRKGSWDFGAYGHWSYVRAGSDHFPAPERPEIRKAFDVGVKTLFVPWAEWIYHPEHRARFFLRFEKQLNREEQDFSFKTYNLSSGGEPPFMSYTLQHDSQFPSWGLRLQEELYRHQYLYNDYWESYVVTGLSMLGKLSYGRWQFALGGSYASQEYTADIIRSQSCSDLATDFAQGGSGASGVTCERIDKITKISLGSSYINEHQQSFALLINLSQRKNDKLIVYDEAKTEILFVFTHAFPTLAGIERYIEPFVGLANARGIY